MTEPNLYNVGYDVGFEDGFKEAQARVLDDLGDDPEIMAASRAEWAARAKAAEAKLAKAVEGFEELARLGNGDCYGSSLGNMIAKEYLAELTGGNDE